MIIDNEDFEIKKSNYYWAGRLMFLPKEKAWQIANEVAEVIDYAQNKALTAPVDVEQREQLKPLPPNECDMCGTLIDPRLTNCGGCGL
jgi:hypothetical protein